VKLLRWSVAGWYAALFALALLACVRLPAKLVRLPWLWGILLCAVFTAVHALYWSDMRMRAPLMPFVCLVGAAGAGACTATLRRRRV
jgi:hypothetical protein